MPWNGARAAAGISGPSIRRPRARLSATTRTSLTCPPGSGPETRTRRRATTNSSSTSSSISRPGATSEQRLEAPAPMRASERQRASGRQRPAWPGNAMSVRNLTLRIWRQAGPDDAGDFETFHVDEVPEEASFLELLDVLNERL